MPVRVCETLNTRQSKTECPVSCPAPTQRKATAVPKLFCGGRKSRHIPRAEQKIVRNYKQQAHPAYLKVSRCVVARLFFALCGLCPEAYLLREGFADVGGGGWKAICKVGDRNCWFSTGRATTPTQADALLPTLALRPIVFCWCKGRWRRLRQSLDFFFFVQALRQLRVLQLLVGRPYCARLEP